MKFRNLAALAAFVLVPTAAIGIAYADAPAVDVVPHVSGAQLPDTVKTNADGVKLQTKTSTDVSVLTLTLDPGAATGWHTHPGLAIISVAEGTGTLYSADCGSQRFTAGEAFIEAGDDDATLFANEGSVPVVLTVTFIAPRGEEVVKPGPGACGLR